MLPPAPASLAASGGVLLGKDYHFDLVRPGVGLYGGNPCSGEHPFQTAVVMTARILQLRRIDLGEAVGYGATFRAKGPTMLATIALGYADGVLRASSNRGAVAVNGMRVPFAGRVSMDLLTLDVTAAGEGLRVGDEVELLGDTIRLADVSAAAGTNDYEILTSLSRRVPRVYEAS
jgi:alanine racemase